MEFAPHGFLSPELSNAASGTEESGGSEPDDDARFDGLIKTSHG